MGEKQFFWVNHKQTCKQERGNNGNGSENGYIWSPKKNQNGAKNETYENLRKVRIGDIIFSYADTKIEFIGIASSSSYDAPKPSEFGNTGDNWDNMGWKVDVDFRHRITTPIKPKEHMSALVQLIPPKHSPIQRNGNGNQGCYLANLSNKLGEVLLKLCEAERLIGESQDETVVQDIDNIYSSKEIPETQKKQLVAARIGQGEFRENVLKLYPKCPVTGINIKCVLKASHIKPWKDSDNRERLDPFNGLMLAAHVDALFDKGFISFNDGGSLIISDEIKDEIKSLKIDSTQKITIYEKNKSYLKWHRARIFKK